MTVASWVLVAVGIAVGVRLEPVDVVVAAAVAPALLVLLPRRALRIACVLAVAGLVVGCAREHVVSGPAPIGACASAAPGSSCAGVGCSAPAACGSVASLRAVLLDPLAAGAGGSARALARLDDGRVVVVVRSRFAQDAPGVPRGASVALSGPEGALDDEGPDVRAARRGAEAKVFAREISWQGAFRGGPVGIADRLAWTSQSRLEESLGPRRGPLVAGMALGRAEDVDADDAQALRDAGLWHLMAASGGNIAMVVLLVLGTGYALRLGDRTRLVAAASAIPGYVMLAGAGPSIQRAGIMGLIALLALALGRPSRTIDALGLAAAATLAIQPAAWADLGWQLSFAATAALVLGAGPVARAMRRAGLPSGVALALATTAVATVATAPLLLAAFGQVSVVGLLTNLFAGPPVLVAVWSGLAATLLVPVAPAAADLAALPGGAAASLLLELATWGQTRQLAVVGLAPALLVAGVGAALVAVRAPRWLMLAAFGCAVVVVALPTRPPREPRMVVLDIGQGSAAVLQDGDDAVLVDAGPEGAGVVGLLRRAGVRRLRAMVLSHPAADHDGGAASVLRAMPVEVVLDGGQREGGPTHARAVQEARRRGVPVVPLRAGQRLRAGRIDAAVRWPTPAAAGAGGDPNDRSGVVEAMVGSLRVIVPGDGEGNVLRQIPGLRADALVVPHHGSDDPELPGVLRSVRPRVAVISVGEGNTYGHPTPQLLQTLRAAGVPALRTDRDGSVEIRAGPDGPVVRRLP